MRYASGEEPMVGDVVESVTTWGAEPWSVVPGDRKTVDKLTSDDSFECGYYAYYLKHFSLIHRSSFPPEKQQPTSDSDKSVITESRRRATEFRDWIKVQELTHPWVRQAFKNNIARLDGVIGDLGVSLAHMGRVAANDTSSERVAET